MEPFDVHTGIAAPLARVRIDTDQVIPKQYLESTGRDGLDAGFFDHRRYLDFRSLDDGWREGRPRLAAWLEGFAARPSMQATRPRA